MTPEQLRENDYTADELRKYAADSDDGAHLDPSEAAIILRAHAAALEEIERLNAAWKAQQFHLEGEERESEHWQQRAEKAEAGRDALKRHAEEVKRDLAASVVKSAELEEENSKLRSALAIVHFKREPWQ